MNKNGVRSYVVRKEGEDHCRFLEGKRAPAEYCGSKGRRCLKEEITDSVQDDGGGVRPLPNF